MKQEVLKLRYNVSVVLDPPKQTKAGWFDYARWDMTGIGQIYSSNGGHEHVDINRTTSNYENPTAISSRGNLLLCELFR